MESLRAEISEHEKIVLLGFGIEGKSTYRFIRTFLPDRPLTIADRSMKIRSDRLLENDRLIHFKLGDDYLNDLSAYDWIIKSPGICLKDYPNIAQHNDLTSQTNLFLKYFHRQTVGITGTKGKSTVSSLIDHILRKANDDVLLVGNIGQPVFDCLDRITSKTIVVYELSSQQLEFVTSSPSISILLNIYEEHLDFHSSYENYQNSKFNIIQFQHDDDTVIFNQDNSILNNFVSNFNAPRRKIPLSIDQILADELFLQMNDRKNLIGDHNLFNMMVAATVCRLFSISNDTIIEGCRDFKSLPHRLEYFGNYHGIDFYDDSISTIAESTIAALKSLKKVNTVILGGYDRGINYAPLINFLIDSPIPHVILVGDVGQRIHLSLTKLASTEIQCYLAKDYADVVNIAFQVTRPQTICLLSPAAASYDSFKNFEERGNHFKNLVVQLSNRRKYELFRQNYPFFVYENYSYEIVDGHLCIEYQFNLSDQYLFRPKIKIPFKSFYRYEDVSKTQLDNLVFHIGMVELISYWKTTCPLTVRIKPHSLTDRQIQWWKKFYFHGLGEFFYRNSISNIDLDHFMTIEAEGTNGFEVCRYELHDGIVIPIGGGKDSIVTLELLKDSLGVKRPMIINPRKTHFQVIASAGCRPDEVIEIERTIDSQLFMLNQNGFFNGHTPFSGLVAFLTLLVGALTKSTHLVLSNESSASEPTIRSLSINHQYSKSFEFENDFRCYVREHISTNLNYFSLLRPLNELQISQLFSHHQHYFPLFKSCNIGIKQDRWCDNCSKCLFTFIILSPFISPEQLKSIFGENLLDQTQLELDFRQLIGETDHKPFECVGTCDEVKQALHLTSKYYSDRKPYLLKLFEQRNDSLNNDDLVSHSWNDHHFLPDVFESLLRNKIIQKDM